jgi:pimeloyl-ACP methyl ester carboxylesterase
MPYAVLDDETRLYYELTGPGDGPVVIQFGGGLFGRHNFGAVNDGFRENGFRLLSFDARGYGASSSPREQYTIEMWAHDGAKLLDAVGFDRVLVHGTSMGGMIAIAFTALHGARVIAACADVAFAKPDVYRRTLFRVWRRMAESMPWDDFSDHVTTQAVGARFLEEEGAGTFELVRSVIGWNDPYTVRQACIAMEEMDLTPLVPRIERPLLMTNGTYDILCPPVLAPSGLGARRMAEMNPHITTHEFPDIGHADLLECPDDAVRIVTAFFRQALDSE